MEFFEVIEKRRSIRRFTQDPVPEAAMKKAFEAAVLAPNSSNTQTWNFFWVRSEEQKKRLVKNCLDQSAARTAKELVIISADPALWRRSQKPILEYVKQVNAPKAIHTYYEKLMPLMYRWGFLNCFAPIKWLLTNLIGIFRPTPRGPYSRRDSQEVAIKSAALAAENFVLALSAQGYSTCMMEGFDEIRVLRQLKLSSSSRIVMVIGIGVEAGRGTWGPRFRIPLAEVLREI